MWQPVTRQRRARTLRSLVPVVALTDFHQAEKIKEVLRLKFEIGLGLRQIARSWSIGPVTHMSTLQRAEAAKITWPLGPEWDEDPLEAALFGGPPRSRPTVLPMPDFVALRRQRQQHPHLTQRLLWEEYRRKAASESAAGRPFSRCLARCATWWYTAARTSTDR
jgi:hypothetical protein